MTSPRSRLSFARQPPSTGLASRSLRSKRKPKTDKTNAGRSKRPHHRVYVVLLDNPRGDGRDGYYVGMTGLPLDERFENHKRGYKSAHIVRKHGVKLAWEHFDGIPAMSYEEAALTEPTLADDLRDLGYLVYGPTNRKRKHARLTGLQRRRRKRR